MSISYPSPSSHCRFLLSPFIFILRHLSLPVSVFLQLLIFSLSSLPLLNSSSHSSFLIPLWLSVLPLSLHFYLLSFFPCFCISPIPCLSIIFFSFTSSSQSSFLIPLGYRFFLSPFIFISCLLSLYYHFPVSVFLLFPIFFFSSFPLLPPLLFRFDPP